MKHTFVFVLYDGIQNSVFEGQIAHLLIQKKLSAPDSNIHLVSYERQPIDTTRIQELIDAKIQVHIFKKKFFIFWSARLLKDLLQQFSAYTVIARGPLAGLLCLRAICKNRCKQLVIQARGLLAEEYWYTHQKYTLGILRLLHQIRFLYLQRIEQHVYHNKSDNYVIEAVSPALKEYIVSHYHTHSNHIIIAHQDIPKLVLPESIQEWRKSVRAHLCIPESAYVYCYNGSHKAWQCSEQTILFFKEQREINPNAFLLIITQDQAAFLKTLTQYAIPDAYYRIVTISHKEIYSYLSAADAGILLRQRHIINWISRPTKLLEYQAVGLKIIHNNTVAYAQNLYNNTHKTSY